MPSQRKIQVILNHFLTVRLFGMPNSESLLFHDLDSVWY